MGTRRQIATALLAAALGAGALTGCGSSSPSSRTVSQSELPAVWGMPPDRKPRGLVLLIHGGGWKGNDTSQFRRILRTAPNYQRLGYETLAFNYRGGAQSFQDAQMFYRLARKRVGPNFPICAVGESAGANIALELAVKNPSLACVLDLAGPTDLTSLAKQPRGLTAYQAAVGAFGKAKLSAYSPALHAHSIRARVLLVYAQDDPIVPAAQGTEMASVLPGARLIMLAPGPVPFEHSPGGGGTNVGVSAAAFQKGLVTVESFLAEATSSWRRR